MTTDQAPTLLHSISDPGQHDVKEPDSTEHVALRLKRRAGGSLLVLATEPRAMSASHVSLGGVTYKLAAVDQDPSTRRWERVFMEVEVVSLLVSLKGG